MDRAAVGHARSFAPWGEASRPKDRWPLHVQPKLRAVAEHADLPFSAVGAGTVLRSLHRSLTCLRCNAQLHGSVVKRVLFAARPRPCLGTRQPAKSGANTT